MLELARIRLQKDAFVVLGLAAAVVLSMPFAIVVTPHEMTVRQAVDAAWVFWLFLGLPGFALLLGGSAGADLASDLSRACETLLPVAPARRAWAAVTAAGLEFAALSAVVLALGAAITIQVHDLADIGFRAVDLWDSGALTPFWLAFGFCLPYLLLASLLAGYVTGSGVLGGLLGAVLGGACLFGLLAGLALQMIHPYRVTYSAWGMACWSTALGGAVLALRQAARRIERRESASRAGLAALAASACLGSTMAVGVMWWKAYHVWGLTRLAERDFTTPSLALTRPPSGGALLQTVGGSLIWASPDGSRKKLLPGSDGTWNKYWGAPSIEWDEEGRLWVLRKALQTLDNWELWVGAPKDGLTLASRFVSAGWLDLAGDGRRQFLRSYSNGPLVASIPFKGPLPEWRKTTERWRNLAAKTAIEDGLALKRPWPASVAKRAGNEIYEIVPALRLGDKLVFPSILENDGWEFKLLRQDGSARSVWKGTGTAPTRHGRVANGGYWVSKDRAIRWLAPDGTQHGPATLPKLSNEKGYEEVLRADGEKLWLIGNNALLVLQAGSAEPALRVELPDAKAAYAMSERVAQAVDEGFFWHTATALYFVDWDGRVRNIGR